LEQGVNKDFNRRETIFPGATSIQSIFIGFVGLAFFVSSGKGRDVVQKLNHQRIPLIVPTEGRPGFTEISSVHSHLTFVNEVDEVASLRNQHLLSGSGVALGDMDGDGWCDLYFCGLESENRLYKNLGNWKFEDVTEPAGIACAQQYSTGAVWFDFDGDHDPDLFVTSLDKPTRCFRNDGSGRFLDVTESVGLSDQPAGMSMAVADIDGDGDLDLYVTHYRPTTIRDVPQTRYHVNIVNDQPVITQVNGRSIESPDLENRFELTPTGNVLEKGLPDLMYLNDGRGHFQIFSFSETGLIEFSSSSQNKLLHDWGLSAAFRDLNRDGMPDLYVCNDLDSPDRLWMNQGGGMFRPVAKDKLPLTSRFSMGVDFSDINRDGWDDFLVLDMKSRDHVKRQVQVLNLMPASGIGGRPQYMRNSLFLNRKDGSFSEIAWLAGLTASDWSWQPVFLDVDLDGYEDLLITNGQARDFQNMDIADEVDRLVAGNNPSPAEQLNLRKLFPPLATGNLAFRNQADLTFEEVSHEWGFDKVGISQGIAVADLDRDGDLDLVVNNLNETASLYRNNVSLPRIAVRLKGLAANGEGVGARIEIRISTLVQNQEIQCGGRYLSGDQMLRVFAASEPGEYSCEVIWPNGRRTMVPNVIPNSLYVINEGKSGIPEVRANTHSISETDPLFLEVTDAIMFQPQTSGFDEWARQPLLPHGFSGSGPGVAWYDMNRDGWEDLIFTNRRGGGLGVYLNDSGNGFRALRGLPPAMRNQTSVLALAGKQGDPLLLVGSSSYELNQDQHTAVVQFDLIKQRIDDRLPNPDSATGPLALADVDSDGDLDLFIGGRIIPGRFPEPASSMICVNQDGVFNHAPEISQSFEYVGLVQSAVFSDLDSDGDPDLLLACQWDTLKVFENHQGRFKDATHKFGLDRYHGLWNGVTCGDFDGDGRMDIAATNWGLNHRFNFVDGIEYRLYYGDLDGSGSVDIVEAYLEDSSDLFLPTRTRNELALGLPSLSRIFPTHKDYAEVSVSEFLAKWHGQVKRVKADTFESCIFLNRTEGFVRKPLPREVQLAPSFGVTVGDYNGDGVCDLFLAQNFSNNVLNYEKNVSGQPSLLLGKGDGTFQLSSQAESGLHIEGDQRAAAVADYDHDGRLDLLIVRPDRTPKLFRNRNAVPGLRLRLKGSLNNPEGIGAQIRPQYSDGLGPAYEVRAGEGFWSQNSSVQIIGKKEQLVALHVRWPGREYRVYPVSGKLSQEIVLSPDGSSYRVR